MPNFKVVRSERRYAGKVFNLVIDEIEYPSGQCGIREVAEHPGGAVVVPLMEDGTLLLVRQYRYPMKEYVLELPAGKLNPGEDPARCAVRELEEETGYTAGTLRKLTTIYTTPGFCSEKLHIYLATDLRKFGGGQHLEEGELDLTVERIPLNHVVKMIERQEIPDSKTICGVFLAQRAIVNGERR